MCVWGDVLAGMFHVPGHIQFVLCVVIITLGMWCHVHGDNRVAVVCHVACQTQSVWLPCHDMSSWSVMRRASQSGCHVMTLNNQARRH